MRRSLRNTSFSFIDQGTGAPALVFLHYFGGSGRSWHEVVARLDDSFRCIAPDLRGFGASGATAVGYDMDMQADDVEALLDALNVDRFVLVGHSMGGKIAQVLAARRPQALEALVLLAPSPLTPEPMKEDQRAQLLKGWGNPAAARDTVQNVTAKPLSPHNFEQEVEDHLRASDAGWRAWLEHGSKEDLGALAGSITVPTLVLSGTADTAVPTDVLKREVVGRIHSAQLVVLPDVGHLSMLEVPDDVAKNMRSFVTHDS